MEDMHFNSGLAFSLNEKEEAVNSKKSDSQFQEIRFPDPFLRSKELFFWKFNLHPASYRHKMGYGRSPSRGHTSDRINPFL